MYYLGLDIGGTKCAALAADETGRILYRESYATQSPAQILPQLFQAAKRWDLPFEVAGVSCGGPLDEKKGVILSPPNLPGWDKVEIVAELQNAFGIPAYLCNDANAGALAEWKFGAGRGVSHLAFLTFGTGLGAGLILNGRLYAGKRGNAGELGHWRMMPFGAAGYGKNGSLEGFCSGGGLAQLAKTTALAALQRAEVPAYCKNVGELEKVTAKTVAEAAYHGDPTAREVYRMCGDMLGASLALLLDLLDLEKVVIGGIFPRAQALLRPAMEAKLQAECLPQVLHGCEIVSAQLGEQIGDFAAITVAMLGKEGLL